MQARFLTHIKPWLRYSKPYILASEIKSILGRIAKIKIDTRFISLKPQKPCQGNVLLSYINEPLFLKPGQPVSNAHTNCWESWQMSMIWLDLGYCVDVINWFNDRFIPQKDYSFLIDVRYNLERIAPLLNEDCVKVMHIETAHCLFHNAAETRRLLELQQRKGVTLQPRRFMRPNWGIEHADCASILGNAFTIGTYRYANKPLHRIPISTTALYPWPEKKDFDACRRHYLWFGSGGLVHKGLDLVLDVFADMPDYHLTVCGPVHKEKDFEKVYYKELYQTPNIHTVGWIDINSPEFMEITENCVGMIYPSCSEGQCGGVVTCLHAGLIPIVSYESGVDIDKAFGVLLRSCSLEEIKNSIRQISSLSTQELELMSRRAWEYARANHTREKFREEYQKFVTKLIVTRGQK